ncbi:MAG: hypothetical protein UHY68_03475 [Acutalibacteraceae bacterium]|nr:hypothetical protein [Acutalibacteraceae bacterium]
MSSFCNPNLPASAVTDVVISGEYSYIKDELNRLGVSTITTQPSLCLPLYERYHPDMQFSYFKKGNVAINKNTPILAKQLADIGVKINYTYSNILPEYPYNIYYNHILLGEFLVCNAKYTDEFVYKYCCENNFKVINVKQGYTKCSTAIVSDNAIITSDNGIYNSCKRHIDVLKIEPGFINLYGYNYGFIGGCCGKLSKDILAFTGKINAHKNYMDIKAFLNNHKVNILELTNKPLVDIGSIIPIKEIL